MNSTTFGDFMTAGGFIQKTVKGTYSSKEITEFRRVNSVGRF